MIFYLLFKKNIITLPLCEYFNFLFLIVHIHANKSCTYIHKHRLKHTRNNLFLASHPAPAGADRRAERLGAEWQIRQSHRLVADAARIIQIFRVANRQQAKSFPVQSVDGR